MDIQVRPVATAEERRATGAVAGRALSDNPKPENVVFYRRAGYEVADEVDHHGVTEWFMRRSPR